MKEVVQRILTIYKLTNRNDMKLFYSLFFLLFSLAAVSQDTISNKPAIKVINNGKAYRKSIVNKPGHKMTALEEIIPGMAIELKYADSNNFTGQRIYPSSCKAYLRNKAASYLKSIQNKLKKQGLGLKIFDAYRPYSATGFIWNLVKDERYAADPAKGSNHNRGIAVDLTIIDLKTKAELNMGTGFDNFSDSAHHSFKALPDMVLKNRVLLKKMMEQNGFESFETEWWHYTLPNAKQYELLDLSFEELKKLTTNQ